MLDFSCNDVLQFNNFLELCKNNNDNKIILGEYNQHPKNNTEFNNTISAIEYNNLKKKYNIIKTEYILLNIDNNDNSEEIVFKESSMKFVDKIVYYTYTTNNITSIKEYNLQCLNNNKIFINKNKFTKITDKIYLVKEKIDIGNNNIEVCLVTETYEKKTYYGCEIVILDALEPLAVKNTIYNIIKDMKNVNNVLSQSVKKSIINKYKKIVNIDKFKLVGSQPHSIKFEKLEKNIKYYLSYKYDGIRGLIFIDDIGDAYIIDKINISKLETKFYSLFKNTIFDCEIYNNKVYIFDLLYYKGNKIESTINFETRMHVVQEILSINKCKDYNEVFVLDYFNYENLYEGLNVMISNIDYTKHDGIILTPEYNTFTKLKWKPRELNTIDFKIYIKNKNLAYLYCYDDTNKNIILEYNKNGHNIKSIITDENDIKKMNNNTVYECTFNYNSKKFEVVRERKDKFRGNFINVGIDNLENILYPFNLELIKYNDTLFNIKRFNNWIKREYLSKYCIDKNVIDINTNNSFDIQKWLDTPVTKVNIYSMNEDFVNISKNKLAKILKNPIYKKNESINIIKQDILSENNVDTNIQIITIFNINNDILEKLEKIKTTYKNTIIIMSCDCNYIDADILQKSTTNLDLIEISDFNELYSEWNMIEGNYLTENEINEYNGVTVLVYKLK